MRETGCGDKPQKAIGDFLKLVSVFFSARGALQEEKYAQPHHLARTVYINHFDISIAAFNLSEQRKRDLLQSGEEAITAFLKRDEPALGL